MKINKHIFGIATLSIALTLSIGLVVNINTPHEEVVAEQHIGDYAPYTYSGNYYKDINFDAEGGMNGALRTSLTTLIKPEEFYIYSGSGETHLSTQLQYADEDPTNSSNMLMLYTRDSVTKTAATVSGKIKWNREHVWCKNRSNTNWKKDDGAEDEAGTDILHLRPTYSSTNSSRGDTKYGDINKSNPKYYDPSTEKVTEDSSKMLWGYSNSTYFEPLDSVKGDVARIIMYVWTTYTGWVGKKTYQPLYITDIFQSYDTLLKWHTLDKPDALEGHRNDYAQASKQKNRNPFVDHPELGWKIFGDEASSSVKEACMSAYPGGEPIEPTGISLDKTTASVGLNRTLQLTATLSPSGATGTVTWSSSNSGVASVNNNGLVTANALGSAVITATVGAYSASCTVTVTEVTNNYGTLVSPLSADAAIDVISDGGDQITPEQMYVRGIVSSNSAFNNEYQNFNYVWLKSDDGNTAQAFELFRVKLDPSITTDYSAANSLVGKEVVACGYGQKYNSTYELGPVNNAQNPVILSVTDPLPPEKTARELLEESNTTSALSYHYVKDGSEGIVDTLNREFTGISGTSYDSWTNSSNTSGISYAGQSAGGNNAIQLRSNNSNSGIVVTANNEGHNAKKVVINWNSNTASGRVVDVYGKNVAYTDPTDLYNNNNTKGTKIGSITCGTNTTLVINNDYQFIALRSNSGALYIDSLDIQWGEDSITYDYSNISIRFGALINNDLWEGLSEEAEILGYGVLIGDDSVVPNNGLIKDFYNNNSVTDHYMPKEEKAKPSDATAAQKGDLEGNYLIWNLKQMIDFTDVHKVFTAAAYIKTDDGVVFLRQAKYSVKTLADDYIKNRGYSDTIAEGSLLNLANLTQED